MKTIKEHENVYLNQKSEHTFFKEGVFYEESC